ncbi:MAG: hypothetical protein NC041_01430 [Bacteroides sp.]|nr:hypothetical protein [Prevotella sp.]MCM1407736.1 ABC transporter permease [Treponema brennaborense]MCM1469114.1 hypothetical protein [Bacteroides sp.]
MPNAFLEILVIAVPLLLVSYGALISEYAGVMAVFLDGIVNLSAFLTFAIAVRTGSPAAGFSGALVLCAGVIFIAAVFTECTRSNPFLTGLAVNLLVSGGISICSFLWFKTHGVLLFGDLVPYDSAAAARFERCPYFARIYSIPASLLFLSAYSFVFRRTRWGMRLRITGSDASVLADRGINPAVYRVLAWCSAAVMASCAGAVLTFRLSSFVPNISAGIGWTGIVIVLLGRKKRAGAAAASVAVAAVSYAAVYVQQAAFFAAVPSALFTALPHGIPLIFLAVFGCKSRRGNTV